MKLCVCVAKETPELQLQGPHHRPLDGGGVTGLGLSFLGGAMSKHLFAAPPPPAGSRVCFKGCGACGSPL